MLLCVFLFRIEVGHAQNDSTLMAPVEEEMPQYPGGVKELLKFIKKNTNYPEAAMDLGISGKVVVQFVIDEEGKVQDSKILESLPCGCDSIVISAINKMPSWVPGRQGGKPVKVYFKLPVAFNVYYNTYTRAASGTTAATFKYGQDNFQAYLWFKIRNPKEAKEGKVQGVVEVRFTVNTHGRTENIKVVKSLSEACDEVVVNAVKRMPKWRPAYSNCQPVSSEQVLSIKFPYEKGTLNQMVEDIQNERKEEMQNK